MDLQEINKIEESFQRTEKALEDEHLLYIEKCKKYTSDYDKFINLIQKEGYVWGTGRWIKKEV